MSSFKSGVVHDPIAVSNIETAMAMLETIKGKSGLLKMDDVKYKAPKDKHSWQLVEKGMKHIDESGNVAWLTYLVEKLGDKKFKRHLEECAYCEGCKERGISKRRVV